MTLLTRVANFAAMSLSLVALIGASTPSLAANLTREAITAPSSGLFNPATPQLVPTKVVETASAPANDGSFDSLDEAVAAQDAEVANDAIRCLAGAIYFEAKGEPLSGQLAVAQVVLNRARSGRFPPDVCDVVTQRGQFGFVRGGRIPSIDEARATYRTAIAVARVALAEAWDGAAATALYFNTPDRLPAARLQRIAAIGNHVFYR